MIRKKATRTQRPVEKKEPEVPKVVQPTPPPKQPATPPKPPNVFKMMKSFGKDLSKYATIFTR